MIVSALMACNVSWQAGMDSFAGPMHHLADVSMRETSMSRPSDSPDPAPPGPSDCPEESIPATATPDVSAVIDPRVCLRAAIARGVSDDFMIHGREQPDLPPSDLSHFDF
tara:strand:+ start:118 stop:447 length:330 start_codon:yes stop_codon:yes gene_type:complete